MTNYQLYRTNVLLGGQMKYDLVINNGTISNIYITPISDRTAFKCSSDNILYNSHQENIKDFYKQTADFFYKDFVDPQLTSFHPLPETYTGKPYESTYEMGLRTSPSQYLHGKKLEFFCPVWIEQISDDFELKFVFELYDNPESDKPLLFLTDTIDFNEQVKNYFIEYIKHIGLNAGCDWVFDINQDHSLVTGFNIETGLMETKKIIKLYEDLTYRERPVLEFNNMIIHELNNHNLITRQLFNFNFCFDLDDIVSKEILSKISRQEVFEKFTCNFKVEIGGQELNIRDIFTNHHFIPKKDASIKVLTDDNTEQKQYNVLEQLLDYKCIDLIYKNKIIQNTCHWCLVENGLHFNTYSGFSSLVGTISIPYISENIVNINTDNFIRNNNNHWCNTYEIPLWGENDDDVSRDTVREKIVQIFNREDLFTKFTTNKWVNGVKYTYDLKDVCYNILCLKIGYKGMNEILRDNSYYKIHHIYVDKDDRKIQLKVLISTPSLANDVKNKYLIFIGSDEKVFHYKTLINKLENYNNKHQSNILQSAINILKSGYQKLIPIVMQYSVNPKITFGPSLDVTEVEYYKIFNTKILMRNFGKIKPYFIQLDNNDYLNYKWKKLQYKKGNKTISAEDENQDIQNIITNYEKYSNTPYQPTYPSVGYTSIYFVPEDYKHGWSIPLNYIDKK